MCLHSLPRSVTAIGPVAAQRPPSTLPNLRCSTEDAREKLHEQIRAGVDLQVPVSRSSKAQADHQRRLKSWSSKNRTLLRAMFTTDELAIRYLNGTSTPLGHEGERVSKALDFLVSLRDQLDLYEEATANRIAEPKSRLLKEHPMEPECQDLLRALVEATRNVPREKRERFKANEMPGSVPAYVTHPGLAGGKIRPYIGDLDSLIRGGLLATKPTGGTSFSFDVTPLGFQYYRELLEADGETCERQEKSVAHYLQADQFRARHLHAFAKWATAEEKLQAPEPEKHATAIGHDCREAMQEFCTSLIAAHGVTEVTADPTKTVDRLRTVLREKLSAGAATKAFLDALLSYWGTVSDLAQRQEHGGQKEGEPLVFEDARRLVFHTAVVMMEIDRALTRR